MLSLLLCVVFMGGALAANSRDSDLYMDTVLSSYFNPQIRANGLDPTSVPNINNAFQGKSVGSIFDAQVNYTRGNLSGLSTAKRISCSAPYNSYGNATLNCTLTFSKLEIKYDAKMTEGRFIPKSFKAVLEVTGTTIVATVTTSRVRNYPTLTNLDFRSLGNVNPKFEGLNTSMNKFLKVMTMEFQNYSIGYLMSVLNSQFSSVLRSSVSKVTMPLP